MKQKNGTKHLAPVCAGAVLGALALALALPGCSAGGPFGGPAAPDDAISISTVARHARVPADGRHARVAADDGHARVPVRRPLLIRVPEGRLTSVRVVKDLDGRRYQVRGRIAVDGLSWRPAEPRLATDARYSVTATALDGHGRRITRRAGFATERPPHRLTARTTPAAGGATVGTGMIFSLDFDRPVEDRAAVRRAVSVTAEPGVPVAPHWFGDSRLDFRPERPWEPGTRVTLRLRLRDVEAAPGVYGTQHRTLRFTVGRAQRSVVDAADHTLRVIRQGRTATTLPVTAGAARTSTYNGKMVISEKLRRTRMNGRTVGFGGAYDIPDVPHAMRLTASGTFLHGNYWADDVFGNTNISHGCVGLRDVRGGGGDTPAGWFYDHSLVGDIVEVVGSDDRAVAPDNGLGGWNMTWRQWRGDTV
ncbi:Ig-like domain-containing protein [Streptomyces sp. NPDC050560]|uniref:L,D-transpeptidase n=1 Tax=Streptomyces sp. NPDC050560 TaxID=3365630 RepID=UPI0037B5C81A